MYVCDLNIEQIIVVNIRTCHDWGKEGDVYIGRGSPYGNPFKMKNQSNKERVRVIKEFRDLVLPRLDLKPLLSARRLGCYCKPLACHGDIIKDALDNMR